MDENMFHKEAVFLNIDTKTSDEVLDFVYEKLYALGYVSEAFQGAVKEREHRYPTGLPGPICDIAVPHTDPEYVKKPFIAVVTTKQGVPFVQMASKAQHLKTRIIFVLGFKTGKYQVKILQTLIKLFIQQRDMATQFLALGNSGDVDACMQLLLKIQAEVVAQELV